MVYVIFWIKDAMCILTCNVHEKFDCSMTTDVSFGCLLQ